MPGFYKRVKKIIDDSDIILEVLDARFPELCRNKALEQYAAKKGKPIILVLNKADLLSSKKLRLKFEYPAVLLSAKKRHGLKKLRALLGITKSKLKLKNPKIGVIGYPNTGKSSLINALAGRKAARTSIKAGFTRGEQWIRIANDMLLIDAPGVMPIRKEDEFLYVLTCSKNPYELEDPELNAIKLIQLFKEKSPEALQAYCKFPIKSLSPEQILEQLAIKRKKLLKGEKPDLETMAKILLHDYFSAKLNLKI